MEQVIKPFTSEATVYTPRLLLGAIQLVTGVLMGFADKKNIELNIMGFLFIYLFYIWHIL